MKNQYQNFIDYAMDTCDSFTLRLSAESKSQFKKLMENRRPYKNILDALSPYLVEKTDEETAFSMLFRYRCCKETKDLLLSFSNDISDWGTTHLPKDLSFWRGGTCWFVSRPDEDSNGSPRAEYWVTDQTEKDKTFFEEHCLEMDVLPAESLSFSQRMEQEQALMMDYAFRTCDSFTLFWGAELKPHIKGIENTKAYRQFLETFSPYLIEKRNETNFTFHETGTTYPEALFFRVRCCKESREALLAFLERRFDLGKNELPEGLCFWRNEKCWYVAESVFVTYKTREDRAFFKEHCLAIPYFHVEKRTPFRK